MDKLSCTLRMMEDSDILTLGWGCDSALPSWPPQGEEFVVLEVDAPTERDSTEYATLEVAKERDRLYYNSCLETEKLQLPSDWDLMRSMEETVSHPRTTLVNSTSLNSNTRFLWNENVVSYQLNSLMTL